MREKLQGTYTLDADCTGTMTFGGILNPSSNVHSELYMTEDHKRGHLIRLDEGNMAIRSFENRRACFSFMSAVGRTRKSGRTTGKSALPLRTDLASRTCQVLKVLIGRHWQT
jgi:hypothetical protein